MAVQMTTAQAKAMGIDLTGAKAVRRRTTRREAPGPYHTECTTCHERFTKASDEDRHVEATKHARYALILFEEVAPCSE